MSETITPAFRTYEDHETKFAIFGEHDKRTLEQLERCALAGGAVAAVLCADGHLGYSQPIGGAIAYRNFVSPSGVGYDIGCGNKAVRTSLELEDIEEDLPRLMQEISARISFGMGVPAKERVDDWVLEKIRDADFAPQRQLYDLAASQLGTVGAGNHYVDVLADEQDRIWVGVHFGSRGFGHKTASGFLALAEGKKFGERAVEGEMDSPPVLFEIGSAIGDDYIAAMELAGEYAHAGRDVVVGKVVEEILQSDIEEEIHNHHNFAWQELWNGEEIWVVRKGCTPAYPGQKGFVGGSMGDISVILTGADSGRNRDALYSTVHGAGRQMSRTQAAGKIKRRNTYACGVRDCKWSIPAKAYIDGGAVATCPEHPGAKLHKWQEKETVRAGKVDWPLVQSQLRDKGIILIGGAADEAPEVYKDLSTVLRAHSGTMFVEQVLRPLGVVMAGADVEDAYKD